MLIKRALITIILSSVLVASASQAKLKARKMKKIVEEVQKTAFDDTSYFQEAFPHDEEIKANEAKTGSLWVDNYSARMYNNLHRASRVGDMVTILIDEEAQGSKTAETKTDRKSSQKFGIAGLFGIINKITSMISGLDPDAIVDVSHDAKHEGKGTTKRKGTLEAKLAARVIKVLKNGDMLIRGQKNIKVNNEDQTLILEGFIRPYDIQPDNTIASTYIADARITYNGFGVVAEQQKPGWLTRVLEKVLPF